MPDEPQRSATQQTRAPRRLRRALALATTLAVTPSLPGTVHVANAQSPEATSAQQPLRVIVCAYPDTEWRTRLLGQLSDLAVAVASEAPPAPPPGERLDSARRLAADVMVWLLDSAAGEPTDVAIYVAASDTLYPRALGTPRDSDAAQRAERRSGAYEAAALAARSAIRAVLAQRVDAPTAKQGSPTPTPTPRPTPKPQAATPATLPREQSTRWGAGLHAGYRASVGNSWGMLSAGLDVQVAVGRARIALLADYGFPTAVTVGATRIVLSRFAGAAGIEYALGRSAAYELGPWLTLGFDRVQRGTRDQNPALVDMPDRATWAFQPAAGAYGALRVSGPHWLRAHVGVALTLPRREYFTLSLNDDSKTTLRTWTAEPQVSLGWMLRF